MDGESDTCQVGGRTQVCVKIANVNDMRPIWVESRKKALVDYKASGSAVESLMPDVESKSAGHDVVYEERKRYLVVVEEIKKIKKQIAKIIVTLHGDANNLDELKTDLSDLKST